VNIHVTRAPALRAISSSLASAARRNLRPLQLAGGVFAAARQRARLVALGLAQLDAIPYIHRCPRFIESASNESDSRRRRSTRWS
jgi:hypothetical protein